MKRILALTMVALIASLSTGCIAVSGKSTPRSSRYSAVATPDGKIYLVDTQTRTAEPVRILGEGEHVE